MSLYGYIHFMAWKYHSPFQSTASNTTKSPWQHSHSEQWHLPFSIPTHSHANHASSSAFAFPPLSATSHFPLPISPWNLLRASPSSPLHLPPSTTTTPPHLQTSPSFSKSTGDSPIPRSNNLLSHCVPRFCVLVLLLTLLNLNLNLLFCIFRVLMDSHRVGNRLAFNTGTNDSASVV